MKLGNKNNVAFTKWNIFQLGIWDNSQQKCAKQNILPLNSHTLISKIEWHLSSIYMKSIHNHYHLLQWRS